MVPETSTASPGCAHAARPDPLAQHAHTGSIDVAAVAMAALHNLGIAGNDLHAGRRRSRRHRIHNRRKLRERKSLFQNEARAQKFRAPRRRRQDR